jgi:hypothetical protein
MQRFVKMVLPAALALSAATSTACSASSVPGSVPSTPAASPTQSASPPAASTPDAVSATPTALTFAQACTPALLLPLMKRRFDDPAAGLVIERVDIKRCRNGYVHLFAIS